MVDRIYSNSEMMKNRSVTMSQEVNDIRNRMTLQGKAMSLYQAAMMFAIVKHQQLVDIWTWLGAYKKAMSKYADVKAEDEIVDFEERAAKIADQTVLDAQGGGQMKDLAAVNRAERLKAFTMFSNFMVSRWNLVREIVGRTRANPTPTAIMKAVVDLMLLGPAQVIGSYLLLAALRGDKPDEDELLKDIAVDPFQGIPLIGETANIIRYGWQRYRGPVGYQAPFVAAKLILSIRKAFGDDEVTPEFLKAFNEASGILVGTPSRQIESTFRGISDVYDGNSNLPAILFGPAHKRTD